MNQQKKTDGMSQKNQLMITGLDEMQRGNGNAMLLMRESDRSGNRQSFLPLAAGYNSA